jgi:hypothetical protein
VIRRLAIFWAALALYFGFRLAPDAWTSLYRHPAYLAYLWSIPVVLLALAWFGARNLARFRGGDGPRARSLGWALGAAGGIAIFVASLFFGQWLTDGLPLGAHAEPFRAEGWRDVGSKRAVRDLTPRQKMVGDLARRVLPGMTRAEIVALLGNGDDAMLGGSDGQLVFHLGQQRGPFEPDEEWLVVELDAADRFLEARILGD